MIIIPTLEIPRPEQPATSGVRDPAELLDEWAWEGFTRAQLTEPRLDDASSHVRRIALDLVRETQLAVQVAGEIDSADDIEALMAAGAAFVVLGPRALDDSDWLASTTQAFPDTLMVEAPAHERRVRSRGWVRTLPVDARDLASELSNVPLGALILAFPVDIGLEHPDLALIEDIAEQVPYPLLVKGGITTLASLRDLEFRGVAGVIVDGATLAAAFDTRTLARDFAD